ncbi:hypothetical protein J5I95_21320, partial [Candidatus Poribacteria bacterium]|nr:hypothetical protein [Candidatus Poribacteria bacterium]
MKLLTLLIMLILCASVSLIGCDQGMTQPIAEVITSPDMEIVTPTQSSLEKAQAAVERVNERRTEVQQKAEETGDFSTILIASENIFEEELGFRKGLWVDLVDIYRQENLENAELLEGLENLEDAFVEKLKADTFGMFYFEYIRAFDDLIVEYLRLSYEFPEKNEEELLTLFSAS